MDQFEILTLIGEGTYGQVFKAKSKVNGKVVAIKKFKESDEDDEHVFRDQQKLYLVFEYVEKTVLEELELQIDGMNVQKVKEIIFQLLDALEFLHSHKIIHRDIKPENLLLDKNGVLKVCDFGFARTLNNNKSAQYTDYVSTRWYRAPELLVGDANYDSKVDIWAVGCIMSELITSIPLFPGDSDIHTLKLVLEMMMTSLTQKQIQAFIQNPVYDGLNVNNFLFQILQQLPQVESGTNKLVEQLNGVDEQIIDFIAQCLKVDPDERMSATQLISHPIFDEQFKSDLKAKLQSYQTIFTKAPPQIIVFDEENIYEQEIDKKIQLRQSYARQKETQNSFRQASFDIPLNDLNEDIQEEDQSDGGSNDHSRTQSIINEIEQHRQRNSQSLIDNEYNDKSFEVMNENQSRNVSKYQINPIFQNKKSLNSQSIKNDNLNRNNSQDYFLNSSVLGGVKKINITFANNVENTKDSNSSPKIKIVSQNEKKSKHGGACGGNNSFLRKPSSFMNQTARDITPVRVQQQKHELVNKPTQIMKGASSLEKIDIIHNFEAHAKTRLPTMKLIELKNVPETKVNLHQLNTKPSYAQSNFQSPVKMLAFPKLIDQIKDSESQKSFINFQIPDQYKYKSNFDHNQSMIITGNDSILQLRQHQENAKSKFQKHSNTLISNKQSNAAAASNYEMDQFPRRSITNRLKNIQALQNKKKMRVFNNLSNERSNVTIFPQIFGAQNGGTGNRNEYQTQNYQQQQSLSQQKSNLDNSHLSNQNIKIIDLQQQNAINQGNMVIPRKNNDQMMYPKKRNLAGGGGFNPNLAQEVYDNQSFHYHHKSPLIQERGNRYQLNKGNGSSIKFNVINNLQHYL